MTIKSQLNESMKDAMRSGDEVRKRTVRMALAAVKQAEVDKRSNPADGRWGGAFSCTISTVHARPTRPSDTLP